MATKIPFSKQNLPKIGTRVSFTRRNGDFAVGKVHDNDDTGASGPWVAVNIGDKKKPHMVNVRPTQLTRA